MTRHIRSTCCLAIFTLFGLAHLGGVPSAARADEASATAQQVELFDGMKNGSLDVKIVVKNDHAARIFIANKTKQPLTIQLPEAFAAVPALAQFGGGGRGGGGGGGRSTSTGGGQQSAGGGLGGGGGGGGLFSVPPEETGKIDAPVVCLDHGLRDPSSSKPYNLVPAADHIDRPAVIELLKAFGRGELDHGAAQAAAWHLNNDLSWNDLAAKLQGTRRNLNRPPYFSSEQIKAAMAYANEAASRAEAEAQKEKSQSQEKSATASPSDVNDSESRSTHD